MHYGVERLGATILPISGGGTRRQVMLMRDFGSTILCSTPSCRPFLYESIIAAGMNISDLNLAHGHFRGRALEARRCAPRSSPSCR